MLTTLRISGFAIIDQAEVRFGPGLNVITGETGAGKSIVVQALHLALGGRVSAEILRDGVDEATVEAVFEVPAGHGVVARMLAAGLPVSPGAPEILVRRVACRSGRGRVFVNGAPCTVAALESCVRGLVDRTGQHEHVSLLDEANHLPLLDAFAGVVDGVDTLARYRSSWSALSAALRDRERIAGDREARDRRADELRAELAEIEKVDPHGGEDVALERERQVLGSAEKLRSAARIAEALVYAEEDSAAERIARAIRAVADSALLDSRLEPALASLRSALAEVEETGRSLARYADAVEGDPERLIQVEERLASVKRLARRHGGTLEAVLARACEARETLAATESAGERLAELDREIERSWADTLALARELTAARAEAAAALPGEIGRELEALAMARCRIEVELSPPENGVVREGVTLGPDGAERAHLLFAPNPGEPARALSRIASGGELSRIVLAIKRALARVDPVDTYVFDEVDAGIGGGVAESVGRLLSEVSRQRQVISVTHLPQVAAFADRHLRVEKGVREGRTVTAVVGLDTADDRRVEVARMLAGATMTDSALHHARALIACARAARGEPAPSVQARKSPPLRRAARTARPNAFARRVGR